MTIAVASDDGIHVAGHAGRAAGFVIAKFANDTLTHSEFRPSPYPGHAHAEHHHGTQAARHEGRHGHMHQHDHLPSAQHEPSSAHAEKHAGIRAALEGCSAMICGGMGHRLMTDLMESGIEVLLTSEHTVQAALDAFKAGTLAPSTRGFCQH